MLRWGEEMIGLYIIMSLSAAILSVVILSFMGPEHSEKRFWQTVQKIRAVIDKVSYYVICVILVGMSGLVAIGIISSLIEKYKENQSVTGVIVSVAIIAAIGLLVFVCIRNLIMERKNGVRCECIGDCSKCKIQCQSNPNYYGIQSGTDKK